MVCFHCCFIWLIWYWIWTDLLDAIQESFVIVPSTFDEALDKSSFSSAEAYVLKTAQEKGSEVTSRLALESSCKTDLVVISADTIVVLGPESEMNEYPLGILEKPKDENEARGMMRCLRGKEHRVLTAIHITLTPSPLNPTKPPTSWSQVVSTTVEFRDLTNDIIEKYITKTTEWNDKAGGYGIQAPSGKWLIKRVDGCYYNVVGLPTSVLFDLLSKVSAQI